MAGDHSGIPGTSEAQQATRTAPVTLCFPGGCSSQRAAQTGTGLVATLCSELAGSWGVSLGQEQALRAPLKNRTKHRK